MPDTTRRPASAADYVAWLHRMGAKALGQELKSLLADPQHGLPRLSIFVPEVSLKLTRIMFLRDYKAVEQLIDAFEGPLSEVGLMSQGVKSHPRWGLDAGAEAELHYFAGRLIALQVCAKRFLLFDSLQRLRQEFLDGGVSQAVLEILLKSGPRSQKSLRASLLTHAPQSFSMSASDLLVLLRRLAKAELLEQRSAGKASVVIELKPLGRQVIQEAPPWFEDVEEAYRIHRRLQATGGDSATRQSLMDLFSRLDHEAGGPTEAASPGRPPRTFAFVPADKLEAAADRPLPRIIP